MSKITAADVNKLRKQTGAGMMDCKNALVEANGDFDAAVDILRKKGQKIAAKRADRDATEGAVIAKASADNKRGVIVSLNCETDFVAKNDSFVELANKLADIALEVFPENVEGLLAADFGGGMTISEKLTEQTGVIGEKLELGSYENIEGEFVGSYIHAGNKLATVVSLSGAAEDAAKDVAMQAAAMNPVALDRTSVSQADIDREMDIIRDQIRQEGKPEEMVDKIAQGKLNKFFKENTLVDQDFIKDGKQSVSQYLNSVEKGLTVTGFKRVGLGV
ncbi:translation elongation factor Ts [Phaeocystidibacter luteus]|uniref:Elongation factor Ts n=1 Tax=Phaeocystidibacter luteus TaxID=911197 RepID=A0A6N6RJF2_9FLAO|nr:translation elongation factor Ts [Phaeocystidibacter luteus]KAB2807085.1 elongation factor Ts [Phaeocystidibacter luteus]